jgi:GNAT superfamily N-acetyltransferase
VSQGQQIEARDRTGGAFYGWRRGWPLPAVASRPGGAVSLDTSPPISLIARLAELDEAEVRRRLARGHHVFLLRVGGEPAAYGWSATGPAEIGGLPWSFTVPSGQRYLWDFVTLPSFRGRGLYPLLLQEIVRRQLDQAEWFWIGHEPDNDASQRGILKAGFRLGGYVLRLPGGELGFIGSPDAAPETTHGAARALGMKHLHQRPDQPHPPTRHDGRQIHS